MLVINLTLQSSCPASPGKALLEFLLQLPSMPHGPQDEQVPDIGDAALSS